ncbi:hypothetical protein PBY51_003403 [Eleginops maclovinus]|uniref:DUF4371 domain-containing protein n=1 Tax=Eleginops maclovinus TaxID=56733 RepID=A0AAN7Y0P4_ELEMC|nr:hypothetical protein PBY51_003403 [Eleginops maclovinus]
MIDEATANKLKVIPLSNNTVGRRILDMSSDIAEQVNDMVRASTRFALQVDEATDSNKDCLLITYVRFIAAGDMKEDLLFCKKLKTRATADELFKVIDTYLQEANLKWEGCVGVCTDGAQAMAGKHNGLQALIKRVSPNVHWTHCMIHREALASKQLSPELNEVMTDVIATVNYIKTRPVKARLFSALCEEMGSNHTAVLFHSEARWLSRGKVLSRVFELREEIWIFLEEEGHDLARYFSVKDSAQYDWILDPFTAAAPTDFSTAEEEQFIDITSDSTLKLQFQAKLLTAFWIGVEEDYPLLGGKAMAVLLPFATSYLCEVGFSAVASIKTKYRSKLDIENELRVAISQLPPRFEKICSSKQAHTSH